MQQIEVNQYGKVNENPGGGNQLYMDLINLRKKLKKEEDNRRMFTEQARKKDEELKRVQTELDSIKDKDIQETDA